MSIEKNVLRGVGLLAAGLLSTTSPFAIAAPWAVIANETDRTISTVDFGGTPPAIHGPHLAGQLGALSTGQGLSDVVVAPDGRFALLANFDGKTVYRVDLSNPQAPTLARAIATSINPLDIAISRDGAWAVVSSGSGTKSLEFIDLSSNVSTNHPFTLSGASAQAVEISPDGRYVVAADYAGDRMIWGEVNPAHNGLLSEHEAYVSPGVGPSNGAISPDGKLGLIAGSTDNYIYIYYFDEAGVVHTRTPISVEMPQSIAFSPDGSRAYVLALNGNAPDTLVELTISGTNAALSGRTATLPTNRTSVQFGIEPLAVSPDGSFVIVGNPGVGASGGSRTRNISRVAVSDFSVGTVALDTGYPTGVALFNPAQDAAVPVAVNYQDLWWNPAESGWGVSIAHQGDTLFAAWYTYDRDGKGTWLVMSNGAKTGANTYSGKLYRTTGPAFNTPSFNPSQVTVSEAGTASFVFSDENNATFSYAVDGVSGSKPIARQSFAAPSVSRDYYAAADMSVSGCSNAQDNGHIVAQGMGRMNFSITGNNLSLTTPKWDAQGQLMSGQCTYTGPYTLAGSRLSFAAPFEDCYQDGTVATLTGSNLEFNALGFTGTLVVRHTAQSFYANCVNTYRVSASNENPDASLENYQDLWWNPAEAGWGVYVAHQGDTLFAAWFAYDASGKGRWLVMSDGRKTGAGTYSGKLYRTTGPAFDAPSFNSSQVAVSEAGSGTFAFTDLAHGTFSYQVDGFSGSKTIARQSFASPVASGPYVTSAAGNATACASSQENGLYGFAWELNPFSLAGGNVAASFRQGNGVACSASSSLAQNGSLISFVLPFACADGSSHTWTVNDALFKNGALFSKGSWRHSRDTCNEVEISVGAARQ